MIKFWTRLHRQVPILVEEALTVSKHMTTSWASKVRQILQTHDCVEKDVYRIDLRILQEKLEDEFVCKWHEELWNDV